MGYIFTNKMSSMEGNHGQPDYLIVDIEPGTVQEMYARAQLTGKIEYLHRDDPLGEYASGSSDKFEVIRINGAHTDSMRVKPYSELHVHPNGQVAIFVMPFKYTVGLEDLYYEDLGLPEHDHLAW